METPKYCILILDDEDEIRYYIKRYLQKRLNADIYEAKDGPTAINIVQEKRPHLCLLDNMIEGDMRGWDVAFEVRTFNKDVKLVILSGDLYIPEKYAEFAKTEIAEVHQKPWTKDQAFLCIQRLLHGATKSPDPIVAPTQTVRPTISSVKHKINNLTMKMASLLEYLNLVLKEQKKDQQDEELAQILTKMGMTVEEYKQCASNLARLEKAMFLPDDINLEAFKKGLLDERKVNILILNEMNFTIDQVDLMNTSLIAAALNKLLVNEDLFNIVASEIDISNKSEALKESFEERRRMKEAGAEDGLQQFNTMILSMIYMKELKWRR